MPITSGDWITTPEHSGCIWSKEFNRPIIHVFRFPDSMTQEEYDANLRLCLNAPKMLEALIEARNQIEYLNEKFTPTGTGITVITRINNLLNEIEDDNAGK